MGIFAIQPHFNRGELSPLLHARIDIDHYRLGLELARNWLVLKHGGLRRRTGTQYVWATKAHSVPSRLKNFQFNSEQGNMLEFCDFTMRVFSAGGGILVYADLVVTGATQTNPVVLTSAGHGLSNGAPVVVANVGGMNEINNREFTAANVTADTVELQGVDGTAYGAYTSGGTVSEVVEVITPYTAEEAFDIHFTQSNDVLYAAHGSHPPQKILRSGKVNTQWSIEAIDFEDGPYLAQNNEATTLQPSATSGSVTLTASAVTGINDDQGFLATDVGRLIRFQASDSHWHYFKVTAFTDTTHVTADYISGLNTSTDPDTELTALPNTNARDEWRLGAWSTTTGYPARVGFFEERLTWARSDFQPQNIWFSVAGDFEVQRPGSEDDDAINLRILAGQSNAVQWIEEAAALLLGTTAATRTVSKADSTKGFSPSNSKQNLQASWGSQPIQPARVDTVALFVGQYGKSIREMAYSFDSDAFLAPDVAVLSEHLLRSGVKQLAWAQDPDNIVWGVTQDGNLFAMTYERDQQVVGFTSQRIAGGDDGNFAVVESIDTVKGTESDELWMVCKRTIGGNTRRYIERLNAYDFDEAIEDAFYVDAGVMYDGIPANVIGVGDHLEGLTVSILADGKVQPEQTVLNGRITLRNDLMASKVSIGLSYDSLAVFLSIGIQQRDGSTLGRRKKITKIILNYLNTAGLKVGPVDQSSWERATLRTPSVPMGTPKPLETGNFDVRFEGGTWRDDGQFAVLADEPLPATIRAVTPDFEGEP